MGSGSMIWNSSETLAEHISRLGGEEMGFLIRGLVARGLKLIRAQRLENAARSPLSTLPRDASISIVNKEQAIDLKASRYSDDFGRVQNFRKEENFEGRLKRGRRNFGMNDAKIASQRRHTDSALGTGDQPRSQQLEQAEIVNLNGSHGAAVSTARPKILSEFFDGRLESDEDEEKIRRQKRRYNASITERRRSVEWYNVCVLLHALAGGSSTTREEIVNLCEEEFR
jgi:hypothetical protein